MRPVWIATRGDLDLDVIETDLGTIDFDTRDGFDVTNLDTFQNIKGTGLDFVYRWLALDQTQARLGKLGQADREIRLAALRELEAFEDYGLVDAATAVAALTGYTARPLDEDEATQARSALARVTAVHAERKHALAAAEKPDLGARLAGGIETLLDPLDSVRRRLRARAIMKDLVDHRISHGRAAKELRALYDRQGGGWLR